MLEISSEWIQKYPKPWIIAGPCSAESEEQMKQVTSSLANMNIATLRAGIWKPRTRPNNFEGVGEAGLEWMAEVKELFKIETSIEVANAQHVQLALEHNVDIVWIGARTTVNPFAVQEIADSLKGSDLPVLIKNPVNPDLSLWIGAIERIVNAGLTKVGAIHRGFSYFRKSRYRNEPVWQIPIELKRRFPQLPLICDPSHIGGSREMIKEICQKALDLNYDGLMVETHPDPDHALSDAKQQITPEKLGLILGDLVVKQPTSPDHDFATKLESLRKNIDSIDHDLLETLAARQRIIEEIGDFKKENKISVLQLDRWNKIITSRPEWGAQLGINKELIQELYKLIHADSIKIQNEISKPKK
ncbi:MAG: bifunctional 3-deoxy-7-phosphoheptulonate synthase/chorismate mutase type II [Bacteroidota bacterium]